MNKFFYALLTIFVVVIAGAFVWGSRDSDDDINLSLEDNSGEHGLMEDGVIPENNSGTSSTGTGGGSTVTNGSSQTKPVMINVTGKNFAFSQTEIKVKKGVPVTVKFTSTDGFHDFVIDELNVASTKVSTGQATSVSFTPNKTGRFEYYCSIGSHRALGMKGTLIVE